MSLVTAQFLFIFLISLTMPKPFWVVVVGRRHAIFIIFRAFPKPEKLLDIRNTENVCPSLDLRSCVLPWRLFTRLAMLAMLPSTTPRAAAGAAAGGPPTVGRPSYSPKEAPNPTIQPNQPNRPAPKVPDASNFHLLHIYRRCGGFNSDMEP